MNLLLRAVKFILIFGLLTLLTQVGGVIYLLYKPIGIWIRRKVDNLYRRLLLKLSVFTLLLLVFSLLIIPPIAKQFGREALPIRASQKLPLRPANFLTVLANRHYVKPTLKNSIAQVTNKINEQYPGTQIIYLDANFPFINNFPLLPHRSHDDGRKLDICFLYKKMKDGSRINKSPTLLGYGFSEKPGKGEWDQSKACTDKGYWQYDFVSKFISKKKNWQFDHEANRRLLRILLDDKRIRKIFIEPHLKKRLKLSAYSKIRFHGCKSVRHDDHIHVQL